ncbi:DNA transposition protein [Aquitalea magnusonii]|uniref:DNA transposition protein n=1 Tax=Aquitalea magnusonii TaxID=332411 RepID=A0A0F3K7C9_9NEIS|nr:ATP-binding protein [Aquitalea magnusonii]KJV26892.1 DNA transposition protein [Aquitalea magnusonii]BBF84912.1 DNA transposition protein [Aquitalea magnusonii]
MTHPHSHRIAPIANLDLVAVVMEKLVNRQDSLPGLAVYYGPSGWGKTTATVAVANRSRAYYVQLRSAWSRKTLLEKILFEMGIKPAGTIPALLDQICEQLAASRRPLILDEFDYCADKHGMIELVRDIYEGSQSSLLLVGEEQLPHKLKRFERFHGRVLSWLPAAAVSLADSRQLAAIYCPDIPLADDLLQHLVALSHGSVRRVSVNLVNVYDTALVEGMDSVDLATWGQRPLYTGEAPRRHGSAA